MAYYDNDTVYQTQAQALNDRYTVDRLKSLAKLICDDIPTRKADIIAAITGAMGGEKIKGVFDRLDRIGQHIVAEAVFAPDGKADFRKIEAKYQLSSGAGRRSGYMSESDLLSLFIINRQVPADMRGRLKTFVPMPKSDHVKYINKLSRPWPIWGISYRNSETRYDNLRARKPVNRAERSYRSGGSRQPALRGRPQ